MTAAVEVPVFRLGDEFPPDARDFFVEHGFVRFAGFVAPGEVAGLSDVLDALQADVLASGRRVVNGIPLRIGTGPDGRPMVNRFAFTSVLSEPFAAFVHDARFDVVREFVTDVVGKPARLSDRENDGVVVNQFVRNEGSAYHRLGWHTDSLRDIAYLREPQPLLQVGVYLTDSHLDRGGLRVLAGTHHQRFRDYLFRKVYFLDNRPDPGEVAIEADAGDLTIHDGRLWHRVAPATVIGAASLRRVMYLPFVTGPVALKDEHSPMPFYHRLQRLAG